MCFTLALTGGLWVSGPSTDVPARVAAQTLVQNPSPSNPSPKALAPLALPPDAATLNDAAIQSGSQPPKAMQGMPLERLPAPNQANAPLPDVTPGVPTPPPHDTLPATGEPKDQNAVLPLPPGTALAQPQVAESALIESDQLMSGGPTNVSRNAANSLPLSLSAEVESSLTLADVVASLYRSYPEVDAARQEPGRANGMLVEAYGAYDTKLEGYSLSQALGFYETYRNGIGVARQTWWGGYVAAGYRVGRGNFEPWYLERETNAGGEFKVAAAQPLLQGRAIDAERVAVFQANLERRAAAPQIQQSILDAAREAANAYWGWVASGAVLQAQRELLGLAEQRGEQYELGVSAGKFAPVDLIVNQQLIAERKAKTLASEQKFRESSYKLSLYLRDEAGQPLVPSDKWLPDHFPVIRPPQLEPFANSLSLALIQRPEPRLLHIQVRQVELERRLACNQMLPRLDAVAEASQDMGAPTSSKRDKSEFELVVGIRGEVPIQRRKARGKIQSTSAKIAQLNQKLRLLQDKIATELQIARNELQLSAQVVQQSDLSLRAAIESLVRYRFAFEQGKVDLIYLNLLESKVNESEIKLVESQRAWFAALADLQSALGIDPLDSALTVTALPPSTRPGPGNLPKGMDPEENGQTDGGVQPIGPRAPANPNAPNVPGANLQNVPGANAQNVPGANAQNVPDANAQNVPGVNAPAAPNANGPAAPNANAPAVPNGNAPVVPNANGQAVPNANGAAGAGTPASSSAPANGAANNGQTGATNPPATGNSGEANTGSSSAAESR